MNIVLLGAPGAGKGTQAEVIMEALNIPAISTGNIIREAIRNNTDLGKQAKTFIEEGHLVPDKVALGIVKERIAQDDCKNGFILDGFPRTLPQAKALDDLGVNIDKVIDIQVDDKHIQNRLSGRRVCEKCGSSYHIEYKPTKVEGKCDKCGANVIRRHDDDPDVVIERLAVYHELTEPLEEYYKKQGKLYVVLGQKEVEETSKLVLEALEA